MALVSFFIGMLFGTLGTVCALAFFAAAEEADE